MTSKVLLMVEDEMCLVEEGIDCIAFDLLPLSIEKQLPVRNGLTHNGSCVEW